jgi:hypothetical protein
MRMIALIAALALTGCGLPPIDVCKGASIRRSVYTNTIRAIDFLQASGRPISSEAAMGRDAAAIALSVLDRNCPVAPAAL